MKVAPVIVADTCLITHLFNETDCTAIAQAVLEKDDIWIVPLLWQEEYGNVLSKLARKKNRNLDQVIMHFQDTVNAIKSFEYVIDNVKALENSIIYKITVYNAHFITLALDFKILVVTEDREVLKKCPQIAVSMKNFLSAY